MLLNWKLTPTVEETGMRPSEYSREVSGLFLNTMDFVDAARIKTDDILGVL